MLYILAMAANAMLKLVDFRGNLRNAHFRKNIVSRKFINVSHLVEPDDGDCIFEEQRQC